MGVNDEEEHDLDASYDEWKEEYRSPKLRKLVLIFILRHESGEEHWEENCKIEYNLMER